MATFAERIRMLRKDRGLSQAELAEELGVAMNTVSIWELGKRMPEDTTITKIAKYFVITEDYLRGKSEIGDLDSMMAELKRLGRIKEIDEDNDGFEDLDNTESQLLEMYKEFRPEAKRIVFEAVKATYGIEEEKGLLQSQLKREI